MILCSKVAVHFSIRGTSTHGQPTKLHGVDARWQYGVVDSGSAYSDSAFARLGHYNAGFMSIQSGITDGTSKPTQVTLNDLKVGFCSLFARPDKQIICAESQ